MFTVKNVSNGTISTTQLFLEKGQSKDYEYLPVEVVRAKENGNVTITPTVNTDSALDFVTDNTGGTVNVDGNLAEVLSVDPHIMANNNFATAGALINRLSVKVSNLEDQMYGQSLVS